MKTMQSLFTALLLALSFSALAQHGVTANRIEVPLEVDIDTEAEQQTPPKDYVMRFTTEDGLFSVLSVRKDGSLTLRHSATIDYSADMVTPFAGTFAGYVIIRVAGNIYMMPIFSPLRGYPTTAGEFDPRRGR